MWSWIKKQFNRAWNFIKTNFHKGVAVVGAGLSMVTVEVFGFITVDYFLLPLAMKSIFALVFLAFGYFLVMFTAIMIGREVFEYLWVAFESNKKESIDDLTDKQADEIIDALNLSCVTTAQM